MKPEESIVRLGQAFMNTDPTTSNVSTLASIAGKMALRDRHSLLRRLDSLLRHGSRRQESNRIAAAKLLVALLPGSMA